MKLLRALVLEDKKEEEAESTRKQAWGEGGREGGRELVGALQEYLDAVHFYETQAKRLEAAVWQFTPLSRRVVEEMVDSSSLPSSCSLGNMSCLRCVQQEEEKEKEEAAARRRREGEEEELRQAKAARAVAEARCEAAVEEQRRMKEDMIRAARGRWEGGEEEPRLAQAAHALAEARCEAAEEEQRRMKEDMTRAARGRREEGEEELRQAQAARAAAEARCEEAREEQGRMKEDMITLACQLQAAEERLLRALEANKKYVAAAMLRGREGRRGGGREGGEEEEVRRLGGVLEGREEELRELKRAIWRLKEECMWAVQQQQQEEEEEEGEEEEEEVVSGAAPAATTRTMHTKKKRRKVEGEEEREEEEEEEEEGREEGEAVMDLRQQMILLQQRLAQARVALGVARKGREEASAALLVVEGEKKSLLDRGQKMEADLIRVRGELAKARKSKEGGREGGKEGGSGRVEELEKQVRAMTATLLEQQQQRQQHQQQQQQHQQRQAAAALKPAEKRQRTAGLEGGREEGVREKELKHQIMVLEKSLAGKTTELARALQEKERATTAAAASARLVRVLQEEGGREGGREDEGGSEEGVLLAKSRQRVWELEEAMGRYRRRAEVELEGRLIALQQELVAAKEREGGREGGREEGEWMEKCRVAEGRAVAAEVVILELRFELEEAGRKVGRYKRRLEEMLSAPEDLKKTMMVMGKKEGGVGVGGGGGGGRRREVAALQAMNLRLRGENESLRAGLLKKTGTTTATSSSSSGSSSISSSSSNKSRQDMEKRLKEARQEVKVLEEEKAGLLLQIAGMGDIAQKLSKREESLAQLRGVVRSKEDALLAGKARCEGLEGEKETLAREVKGLRHRLMTLEKEVLGLRGTKRRRPSSSSSVQQQQQQEEQQQQQQVEDDLHDHFNASLSFSLSSSSSSPSSSPSSSSTYSSSAAATAAAAAAAAAAAVDVDVVAALQIELSHSRAVARETAEEHQRLVEENGRLLHELSAFDLSFWEELEDLKYAHQQALRQVEEARGSWREGGKEGGRGRCEL